MKLPNFFGGENRKRNEKDGSSYEDEGEIQNNNSGREPQINSTTFCPICSGVSRGSTKTAKLLIITAEWNFYYCYRCRGWYQVHYKMRNFAFRVPSKKLENALTWFWMSESELIEENRKTLNWVHNLLRGFRPEKEAQGEEGQQTV